MAAFVYDEGRKMLSGDSGLYTHQALNWTGNDVRCAFIDEGTDTPSQTADADFGDRTGFYPTTYSSTVAMTTSNSISSSILVLDSTDTTFTALDTSGAVGANVESLDIFVYNVTQASAPMISNHDDYTGLPVTGTGGDVTVVWAATGIIRI